MGVSPWEFESPLRHHYYLKAVFHVVYGFFYFEGRAVGGASVGGASVGGASVGGASVGGASVGGASVVKNLTEPQAHLLTVSFGFQVIKRCISSHPLPGGGPISFLTHSKQRFRPCLLFERAGCIFSSYSNFTFAQSPPVL